MEKLFSLLEKGVAGYCLEEMYILGNNFFCIKLKNQTNYMKIFLADGFKPGIFSFPNIFYEAGGVFVGTVKNSNFEKQAKIIELIHIYIKNFVSVNGALKLFEYLLNFKKKRIDKKIIEASGLEKSFISIVVPTFNKQENIELMFENIYNINYPKDRFEVIVADDGGNIDLSNIINEYKSKGISVKYIWQENLGFRIGQARNLGSSVAGGEILLFLNDDNLPDPNILLMHNFYQRFHDVILGTSKGYGKFFGSFENMSDNMENSYDLKSDIVLLNDNNDEMRRVFVANHFSIKKKYFEEIRFDENFIGWGGEDIELGLNISKNNHKIYFADDVFSYHISKPEEVNGLIFTDKRIDQLLENFEYFFTKHTDTFIVMRIIEDIKGIKSYSISSDAKDKIDNFIEKIMSGKNSYSSLYSKYKKISSYDQISSFNNVFKIYDFDLKKKLEEELSYPGSFCNENFDGNYEISNINSFYENNSCYIIDLCAQTIINPSLEINRKFILLKEYNSKSRKIFDFGGGIGEDTIFFSKNGFEVDYFDIGKVNNAFVKYRNENYYKSKLNIISEESEIKSENYDIIICFEVIEHLFDPSGLLQKFHNKLKKGGRLYITESFGYDKVSLHIPENYKYSGKLIEMAELIGFNYQEKIDNIFVFHK